MRYFIVNLLFILSVIVAGYAARTYAVDSSSGAMSPSVTTMESPARKSEGSAGQQYPSGITSPPVQPPNLTDGAIKKAPPKVRSDAGIKSNLKNSETDTLELERKHSGDGLGHDNKREQ